VAASYPDADISVLVRQNHGIRRSKGQDVIETELAPLDDVGEFAA
jgi:hypothetical protein